MRILPPVEEEIRRIVRDARAKDPLVSVMGLKTVLEKRFERGFSHQYVSKIADKVLRERLVEADRTKIEQRINFTRENYRMMREQLLKIVYWEKDSGVPRPLAKDVIEAAKNVVMMDLALLNAEVANGMYKSQQDAVEQLHYAPLPAAQREIVLAAFVRWGMIPKAQAEAIVGPAQLPHGSAPAHTGA